MTVLLRPCRSQYIDKHDMPRHLKPNIVHGAYFIYGERERLLFSRKHTDEVFEDDQLPPQLLDYVKEHKGRYSEVCLRPEKIRELGYPVPEIPAKGWAKRRFYFWNDAGGVG